MTDDLRALWDFADLDATERRFGERLEDARDDGFRAEVLTQLARVHGLRGRFDEGDRLLERARALAGADERAWIRIELEAGRLRRSRGDPQGALPLFEAAYTRALDARELFLAGDAAHMAALAAPDADARENWAGRGIELGEDSDEARYWLGPLLNNVGWERFEEARYEEALVAFERALSERERDRGNREALELARYAVARTLRALARAADALPHAELAVSSATARGVADSWFHEELAESYEAAGRRADAAEQARLALACLEPPDDPERAPRLRELAGEPED